eukprot:TRINITY_DN41909_c0_g1_i1.p1 TRINITY_DN41909_c0_g1~~TRINITY_DN41909_c0_g1_i1.p1  ORF type:complete len:395 (-),score=62.26 TRINITY_DN41909_c0_g1_i1:282-1373(-)
MAAAMLTAVGAKKPNRPKTVMEGATDFGGGSPDVPGHLLSMQENGHKQPVAELTEIPLWDDFYQNYVRANRPVVLRGAARTQPAFEKWTDEYLLKLWGSRRQVDAEIKKVEVRGGPTVTYPFSKFLKEIYKEERKDELYAVIGLEDDPKALADVAMPEPARCKEVWPQSVTLWMSAGGTMSVLHNDDGENFLMLIDGYKSVMLVHQDQARNIYAPIAETGGTSPVLQDKVDLVTFPRFANVTWLHGEIGPGDTLFIPHTYWHQVNSRGRNLGINIWWSHRDDWRWWDLDRYDAKQFGSKRLPSFNEFKESAAKRVNCTRIPDEQHMDRTKLVDEGRTKEIIRKKREKHVTRRKDRSAKQSGEL